MFIIIIANIYILLNIINNIKIIVYSIIFYSNSIISCNKFKPNIYILFDLVDLLFFDLI